MHERLSIGKQLTERTLRERLVRIEELKTEGVTELPIGKKKSANYPVYRGTSRHPYEVVSFDMKKGFAKIRPTRDRSAKLVDADPRSLSTTPPVRNTSRDPRLKRHQ